MSDTLTIGRILIAAGVDPRTNNGSDRAPAFVVRVLSGGNYVNARVMLDGPDVAWWTSRQVFADEAAYDAAAAEYAEQFGGQVLPALYWPSRV